MLKKSVGSYDTITCMKAYLDIETTGLSFTNSYITVVGIMTYDEIKCVNYQLYGENITDVAINEALKNVDVIYTFNGARFDLPFIKNATGLNVLNGRQHVDLMYSCRRRGFTGGLKKIEKELGIDRDVKGCDGYMAIKLWWQYVNNHDKEALDTLLRYNMDDVKNLRILEQKLLEFDKSI